MRALLENLSGDPLHPNALPTREFVDAAGAILRQTEVRSLVLLDDLGRALDAAAQKDGGWLGPLIPSTLD